LLGAAKGQFKKKSRENADCKFHMCLRMRAVKKKHYSQRVPIVGYKFESLDVSFDFVGFTPVSYWSRTVTVLERGIKGFSEI